MRQCRLFLMAGLLLSGGCVPSLRPFYTDGDLVFEPALLGGWEFDNNEWTYSDLPEGRSFANRTDKCTFSAAPSGNSYLVRCVSDDGACAFDAHLFRLGDVLFLDLLPLRSGPRDFYDIHFVRAHTVARVWLEGDLLRLGLDPRAFPKPGDCNVTAGIRTGCSAVYGNMP